MALASPRNSVGNSLNILLAKAHRSSNTAGIRTWYRSGFGKQLFVVMKRNVPDSWLSVVLRHLDNSQKRMITALNHSKTFHQGLTKAVRTGMCLLAMAGLTAGGSVFQNLDFEAGPIYYPPVNEYYNIYSDVLPHWTVRFGNIVQPGASCNNFTLDYPVVALMSSGGALRTSYVIDGQRSVYLQSASTEIFNNAASAVNVAISQVGTVPATTASRNLR